MKKAVFGLSLAAALLLGTGAAFTPVQAKELFYQGDLDAKKTTAANGGIVNVDYYNWLTKGSFGAEKMTKVRNGVYTLSGYSISNYTFIEGETGLIAFDTGNNIGMGKHALAEIRKITDKPIIAIIYSHHHYTGGARVYVEEGGGKNVKVYGHPDLDANLQSSTGALGPMQQRRAGIQLGLYLPTEGPDTAVGPAEPHFDDPALAASGHVPVSIQVADGEEVEIDGIKFVFHHAVADTRDSLIVEVPELDLVLHNTNVTPMAFSMYTLRGDFYRDPIGMIGSIDKLREINATYVVGAHGYPITSAGEAYEIATAHRDTYAFIYNQSIRAINSGKTPNEMAETIRLPEHLKEHAWLFPAYVDNEYNVRGQYRGIVGWYAEDTADLHPPTTKELGEVFIQGFGGTDQLIAAASNAYSEKKYNLTAKLLSYVIAVEPDNMKARQLKADALRTMAQTTRAGIQTRNFMLTHALHLEGKLDWTQPSPINFFGTPTVAAVLATPPGTNIKLLETQIDPAKSADLEKVIQVTFTDIQQSWGLHIRRGVAEVTVGAPEEPDAIIELPRTLWAQIVLGETTLEDAISKGDATVKGSKEDLITVFDSFG
jgi:alkyl sulfatase BDS1-like metallo-beta-lactamase superfamily hydrolase